MTAKGYPLNLGRAADEEAVCMAGLWRLTSYVYRQPKLYLGYDQEKADVAEARLRQMWKQITTAWETPLAGIVLSLPQQMAIKAAANASGKKWDVFGEYQDAERFSAANPDCLVFSVKPPQPIWDRQSWGIAKAIAKGSTEYVVSRQQGENDLEYVERIGRLRQVYSVVSFVAEDAPGYQAGAKYIQSEADKLRTISTALDTLISPTSGNGGGPTFHQALVEYAKVKEAIDTPWGRTQADQADRLRKYSEDLLLGKIDLSAMQRLFDPWRNRQTGANGKPITCNTAKNQTWQMKDFFNWLHKRPEYPWRRPADCWLDLDLTIRKLEEDTAKKNQTLQVKTYSIEELAKLYRHATPLVRCMMAACLKLWFQAS